MNSDLAARRLAAVPRGVSSATTIFADHALNAELWDVEGRRYVDFSGGIGVLNVGHRHPKVMAAVDAQLKRFTHTAFQVVGYDLYVELAERLNAVAPFSGDARTIFFTTGAEATENCIKIARAATGRSGVIAFVGGFHGRTALTSPFPRDSTNISVEDSLRALDFLFAADIAPQHVAAIIIEPVQGEGGFHVAPTQLLEALRQICDDNGILLIAHEVQSGFARTGKMCAIEHSGIERDLVAVAKSMAGGFPLSGVIGRADVMHSPEPGGLGGTYSGSPIACAAALAVLEVIEDEGLIGRATVLGTRLRARMEGWCARNDLLPVANICGLGAMVAFDLVSPNDDPRPDGSASQQVCQRALQLGLIVLTCGSAGHTIRVLVPLTASDAVVDEGLDCLEGALMALS